MPDVQLDLGNGYKPVVHFDHPPTDDDIDEASDHLRSSRVDTSLGNLDPNYHPVDDALNWMGTKTPNVGDVAGGIAGSHVGPLTNPLGDNYQIPGNTPQAGSFTGIGVMEAGQAAYQQQEAQRRHDLTQSTLAATPQQRQAITGMSDTDFIQTQQPSTQDIFKLAGGAVGGLLDTINPYGSGGHAGKMIGETIGPLLDPTQALTFPVTMAADLEMDPVGTTENFVNLIHASGLNPIDWLLNHGSMDVDTNGNKITPEDRANAIVMTVMLMLGGAHGLHEALKPELATLRPKIESEIKAGGDGSVALKEAGLPTLPEIAQHFGVDPSAVTMGENGAKPTVRIPGERSREVSDLPYEGFFHGTSKPIEVGSVWERPQDQNLYGPGLYLTDDPNIAKQYTKKGNGAEPVVYKASFGNDNPNLINLDEPVPESARKAFEDHFPNFEEGDIDWSKPGTEIYKQMKEAMIDEGYTRNDADENMTDLVAGLQQAGYDGFAHRGGGIKGKVRHNVRIMFGDYMDGRPPVALDQVHPPIEPPVDVPPTTDTTGSDSTGLARRFADNEADQSGKERTPTQPVNVQELTEQGKTDVEGGSRNPKKILDEVTGPEGRLPTKEEVPAVTYYKMQLRNELTDITNESKAGTDPARQLGLDKRSQEIEAELQRVEDFAQKARHEFHGFGQALQTAYNSDYSQANLSDRAQAANHGKPVSEATQGQIDAHAQEIAKQTATMETAQKEAETNLSAPSKGGSVKDKSAILDRIRKATGAEAGKVEVGKAPSKKTGAIIIDDPAQLKLKKDVRALAKIYIDAGAKGLDEILSNFHRDLPHLNSDHVLDLLSDKYAAARKLRTASQLSVERQIKAVRQDANFRQKSFWKKGLQVVQETVDGLTRTAKLLLHASAPFMQGKKVLFESPKSWLKAWPEMVKGYISGGKAADLQMARFHNDPLWEKAQKVGMDKVLAQQHGSASQTSEEFRVGLTDKIPFFGKVNEHSSAAFNGFLNEARWQMFKKIAEVAPNDLDYLHQMTVHIGELTGRSISKGAQGAASLLSGPIFSPRYTVSKYEYLAGKSFWEASGKAKGQIAQGYAKVALGNVIVGSAAAQLLGGKVDLDPRSANFGTVTIGNNVIDLFHNEAEPVRLFAKMFATHYNTHGGEKAPEGASALGDYIQGKMTPIFKFPFDLTLGNYTTKDGSSVKTKGAFDHSKSSKPEFDWMQELQDMVEPITIQSAIEEKKRGADLSPFLNPLGITTRANGKKGKGGPHVIP